MENKIGPRNQVAGDVTYSYGDWVARRRKSLRLTQREVANLVGCSLVLMQKIESDARRPSAQIAELLARALHVAPSDVPTFVRVARAEYAPDRLPPPDVLVVGPLINLTLLSSAPVVGNVPAAVSSFIGRRRELDQLHTFLSQGDVRLLTLTGAGGSGKTRLALEAVHMLTNRFPGGVWFVDLAPVADPFQLLRAMMHSLGVVEDAQLAPRESLLAWLRPRRVLIVIDNFEHLLSAAPLLSDLLQAAPLLHLLVTSRVPLRLRGEQEFLVEPLAISAPGVQPYMDLTDYDAVQLFVSRAQLVRTDFVLTPTIAPIVVEICAQLDGLPLAIELACTRLRLLSTEQLLGRLQAARMQTLIGGARDLPARQQTIHSTIAWSYRLLTPSQQVLLTRLSVFVGGWDMSAAEAVCGDAQIDVPADLEQLVEHNLVRVMTATHVYRYIMLETIREYALEQLQAAGQEAVLRQRHAAYYVAFAEQVYSNYWWPPDARCIGMLDREVDNFRAVLRWSLAAKEPDQDRIILGLQLIIVTHQYWEVHRSRVEGYQWLAALYAASSALPRTLRLQGALALVEIWKFYDQHGALALIQSIEPWALQIEEMHVQIWFFCNAGWVASFCDLPDMAIAYWNIGLELAREQQHLRWEAEFLTNLGSITFVTRQFGQSEQFLRAALQLSQDIGDLYQIGESLYWLTQLMVNCGDLQQAAYFASAGVDVGRKSGNRRNLGIALERLGFLLLEQGNRPAGEEALREAIDIARMQGNNSVVTRSLYHLGRLQFEDGDLAGAEVLLRESVQLVSHPARPILQLGRQLRQLLLGWIAAARGDRLQMLQCYCECLRACQRETYPYGVAVMLEHVASFAAEHDGVLAAVRFWGAAAVLRQTHTSLIRPLDRFVPVVSGVAVARTVLGDLAFDLAWAAGEALTWEQAADEASEWLQQAIWAS